jgi:hypothetical protein
VAAAAAAARSFCSWLERLAAVHRGAQVISRTHRPGPKLTTDPPWPPIPSPPPSIPFPLSPAPGAAPSRRASARLSCASQPPSEARPPPPPSPPQNRHAPQPPTPSARRRSGWRCCPRSRG